jgi:hypothetical protein
MGIVFALLAAQDISKEELREGLRDDAAPAPWIYDDLDAARVEAKKSGRPLLVLARCVP